MSLVVSPEFARAMALELVRRYDFDPNFVFATVLLFIVFTFGFVVGTSTEATQEFVLSRTFLASFR